MGAAADEIQVWIGSLAVTAERLRAFEDLLGPDEKARAASLRIERVRRRFVASRGLVREVLGREAGADPRSLRFALGPRGKPSIAPPGSLSLEFNVSHSDDLLAIAIARGRAVGVDVEVARETKDFEALASRFFSPCERDVLLALDPPDRMAAFFACWTRKEAYIKARGEGLAIALDRFDVAFAPGDPPALLADRGDPDAAREWTIADLTARAGVPAALAVETKDRHELDIIVKRLDAG